nr:hypothetical protein [Tanacetum cinerariifolium]
METVPNKDYILLPLWTQDLLFSSSTKDSPSAGYKPSGEEEKKDIEDPGNKDSKADFSNLEITITVSPIPTTRVHKDHLVTQIIGDLSLATQTRSMTRMVKDQGIDHEEVFALVARMEAIRLFLAYASFMGFMVYQIDAKSAFLYGTIKEEVYFDDIIFGSTNKDLCKAFEKLRKDTFQMSSMGELTFFLDGKSASTPIDTEKPLLKDLVGEDVDVQTYRSMIGSLMYLTLSIPDIMFAVCAYVCFQVTPKASHLHAVKRIFRYLKGKPHLGLWYPKDSSFNLVAYSDSDYAGASLDRKSTTGDCQFLGCRLISWQCKKQTIVATSLIEAENKLNERGIVIRNKVVPSLCFIQGLCGVPNGCEECFSLWKIEEEVYVFQPPGFEDPDFPNKVYKVEKCKKQIVVANSTTEVEYVAASNCCG